MSLSQKLRQSQSDAILSCGKHRIDLSQKTHLMGVLNVTPDSFSDGGLYRDSEKAVRRGLEIEKEGASIIDVGGESTRPGSRPVSADEELARVLPVISRLAARVRIPIAIDTTKPIVAREALKAGASIINNVIGTPLDSEMAEVACEFNAAMVLMHIRGTPQTMHKNVAYEDLITDIISELKRSITVAEEHGLGEGRIVVDPGIGFSKTASQNLEILQRLRRFRLLDKPILVGPSRKSFIGKILAVDDPCGRLMGTAAAVTVSVMNGANIIRVHDVKEMAQVAGVADSVNRVMYKGAL